MNTDPPRQGLCWDIFCRVIDNFGDIGVCWRLAANLAQRGQTVRLWVDDASALSWLAPDGMPGVQVRPWTPLIDMRTVTPGDVMLEAFGCEIAPEFIASYAENISARGKKSLWINLEYLSAESFAERCHGLPSPVMSGPGRGLTKFFYYPGFTPATGGLLREPDLLEHKKHFDRVDWIKRQQIPWQGERLVSLFCYEPAGLTPLLDTLANDGQATLMLVCSGRATAAVHQAIDAKNALKPNWNVRKQLSFLYLPTMTQHEFDHLLWTCDLNFVRGEDSLVRALWAGKATVWQIYPQDDGAHRAKLDAYLDWLQAPASLRAFHYAWNGFDNENVPSPIPALLNTAQLESWQQTQQNALRKLSGQQDLASSLLQFVSKNH